MVLMGHPRIHDLVFLSEKPRRLALEGEAGVGFPSRVGDFSLDDELIVPLEEDLCRLSSSTSSKLTLA